MRAATYLRQLPPRVLQLIETLENPFFLVPFVCILERFERGRIVALAKPRFLKFRVTHHCVGVRHELNRIPHNRAGFRLASRKAQFDTDPNFRMGIEVKKHREHAFGIAGRLHYLEFA
jgi:hypothetical protein